MQRRFLVAGAAESQVLGSGSKAFSPTFAAPAPLTQSSRFGRGRARKDRHPHQSPGDGYRYGRIGSSLQPDCPRPEGLSDLLLNTATITA